MRLVTELRTSSHSARNVRGGVVGCALLTAVVLTAAYATGALLPALSPTAPVTRRGWAALVERRERNVSTDEHLSSDSALTTRVRILSATASLSEVVSETPSPSRTMSATATPAETPSGVAPANNRELPAPTAFPDGYVSSLVRAARLLGMTDSDIPDIGRRGRENADAGCPPYIGGLLHESDRAFRPTLESLGKYTISLITVSYRTPKSLANAVGRWSTSGLLDFFDEKVMFLNAAIPEEKALGAAHGFKVLTAEPEDIEWLVRRHRDEIYVDAGNEFKDGFPYVQVGEKDGLHALWIAPSLLLSLHETASTINVFLEKDYATNPKLTKRDLARQLLAGVAALTADVAVVRLRDLHDPDRWALPNCWCDVHLMITTLPTVHYALAKGDRPFLTHRSPVFSALASAGSDTLASK